ncbi:phosphate signaling complex protein PhoU [Priestia taiwanensis]|uniref:Phosphate-specific transport system accessory protein PhoU n=1 Tax=Priestia taiwanensis TaxID=1347902 RepID=A0A917ATH6_9BACI|nr:phosphate signaling complex protein PhoU [Priestia taiwanensis]MBM7363794.1 phosphate transport system protein [Priestia taiwanensis]GGE74045.1 phosphate transport system regulatory protein PhoU [Priestia taiwanensis]
MGIRGKFEGDLHVLHTMVMELGDMAIESINLAFEGLKHQDIDKALSVIENDEKADDLEEEINDFAIMLLTKQQPVAIDLRKITTVLKISSDLERIADYAVNIAKAAIRIGEKRVITSFDLLEEMHSRSIDMVRLALRAYDAEDLAEAKKVATMDDEVDALYGNMMRTLMQLVPNHQEEIGQIMQLTFITRYFERIADYATNISENTFYLVKGRRYTFNE